MPRRPFIRPPLRLLRAGLLVVLAYYASCGLVLLALNVVDPPTTGVQVQRRLESLFAEGSYEKRYDPVPLDQISPALRHAAVAAEDGRFFDHHGVDWEAVREALDDNRSRRRARGGSTITQQLVKNLFLTTHSTVWRKAVELPLAYLADLLLPKRRILELYLNVIEWGDGVYGAEAAARHHYGTSAARLSRDQASRLAACIPAPRSRNPRRMDSYSRIIRRRMSQMGW